MGVDNIGTAAAELRALGDAERDWLTREAMLAVAELLHGQARGNAIDSGNLGSLLTVLAERLPERD